VAEAGGVVNVVGAEQAGDFLGDVVGLVGEAARGGVEGNAARVGMRGGAETRAEKRESFIPGDAVEAGLAAAAKHGKGQAAKFAEAAAVERGQTRDIGETSGVERRHGVEAEQLQADQAEVDAGHGVVAEAAGAERAAVADAVAEDAPGVGEIVAVFPDSFEDFEEVVGLGVSQSEGHPTDDSCSGGARRHGERL